MTLDLPFEDITDSRPLDRALCLFETNAGTIISGFIPWGHAQVIIYPVNSEPRITAVNIAEVKTWCHVLGDNGGVLWINQITI